MCCSHLYLNEMSSHQTEEEKKIEERIERPFSTDRRLAFLLFPFTNKI